MFGLKKVIPGLGRMDLKKKFKYSMRTGYMKDFTGQVEDKFGKKVFSSGIKGRSLKKEYYEKLRQDSKERSFGEKGFTKKRLTQFYAKMLNDKKDHFTDRNVMRMIRVAGLKKRKVLDFAAAMQRQTKAENVHPQPQAQNIQTQKQERIEFSKHINEILTKSSQRNASSSQTANNAAGSQASREHNAPSSELLTKFEISNANIRKADDAATTSSLMSPGRTFDQRQTFGHLMFLKNKHHDFAAEDEEEEKKVKARLAMIQGTDRDAVEEKVADEE